MNDLLIVAAHPDDEVLGCGATVRLMVNRGWKAHLAIMTKGVAGRFTDGDAAVTDAQQALEVETQRAAKILGIGQIYNLGFPDNRMDTVGRMDIALKLRPIVETIKPALVFTHHPGDYNWDHQITFDSVMMACRRDPTEFGPPEIRTFEVLSSTERSWSRPATAFCPSVFVNVAATIDAKKRALCCYTSEYRAYPHPRSVEAVEYLARKRGNEVGLPYAEAFELVRKVEE